MMILKESTERMDGSLFPGQKETRYTILRRGHRCIRETLIIVLLTKNNIACGDRYWYNKYGETRWVYVIFYRLKK